MITFTAMADPRNLRADPQAMQGISQALSGAATDLEGRLRELDGEVREMLAGWHGGAGSAYGMAWDQWHQGAGEVQRGLAMLAKAVSVIGVAYQNQEASSVQNLRSVTDG
jgi:WXG100 family type VII secretion target